MADYADQPLPEDFYEAKAWFGSLIEFYSSGKQKKFERNVLEMPLTHLTVAIETIVGAYGNSSHVMVDAFEKATNPLYEPGEYKEGVYDILHDTAVERKDVRLHRYAESLMFIRNLFEKKEDFLLLYYKDEIAKIQESEEDSKVDRLAVALNEIVKVHIKQVIKMIKEVCMA